MGDAPNGAAKGGSAKPQAPTGALENKVQGATKGILSSIQSFGSQVALKGKELLDRVFPPEQRASLLAKIQSFMLSNPKLSAFLGMNFALTGIPLGLFFLFTLTVALFSLVVGLIVGLLAAVAFTLFCVGVALCFVLPTIFFTTMTACFLFLWGLGGYYVLRWLSGEDADKPAPEGGAIGDRLNALTGGRLSGFMGAAKDERSKNDISGYNDKHTKPNYEAGKKQQSNGSAHKEANPQKQVSDAASKATKASGVDQAQGTATTATGTAKGGVSGAAGATGAA